VALYIFSLTSKFRNEIVTNGKTPKVNCLKYKRSFGRIMKEEREIPRHWKVVPVGEYVISIKGKKPKRVSSVKTNECSIPYVNIKAFEKNLIDEYTDGVGCVLCEEDDFLMVWDGSRSGYVGRAIKGALGSTLVKLKFPNLDINYAYYFLQSKYIEINTRAKGIGIPHVDPNLLWNYLLPIPPLPEQLAIVSKIEELLSELENGKQQLQTAQQQLKAYRQSLLKWAFEGKLTHKNVNDGELPEGWKLLKVASIGQISTGSTPSKQNVKFYSDTFPFYKPTDLEAGYNVRRATDNLSELGIKEARFLPKDSILVTCIGATIGKTGIIRRAGASNQQINAIIPSKEFNANFIYYQTIAPKFQKTIKDNASATTLPILNKSKFQNLELASCTLDEQQLIVDELESKLTICDKIEETINQSLQQAESLRQSILKKAFEGKLV
jgi:type I restriction enzyme, S subunit